MNMSASSKGYEWPMSSIVIECRPNEKHGPILMRLPGLTTYMSIEEAKEMADMLNDAISIAEEDAMEKELIEIDFDGLSDAEIKVLLLMNEDRTPVSPSRLQRMNQLYEELYESKREV